MEKLEILGRDTERGTEWGATEQAGRGREEVKIGKGMRTKGKEWVGEAAVKKGRVSVALTHYETICLIYENGKRITIKAKTIETKCQREARETERMVTGEALKQ